MKIKDIQIDGFGVWTGLSVDSLPEGMTLFYGPNEAGKTTLMQFLRAMLYGFTDERRQKYLPPIHGGTPGGAIRVTGPGGGYEIRRHSQLTDTDVTGRLTVTGSDGLAQGQHRLAMLLGQIDEPIFTNVFAIGIRELQELSTLDDTSAADELYKLSSGLDRVSLVDVLRSLRAGRNEVVGKRESESDESEAAIGKLASMMTKREKLRDEIQRLSGSTRRWSELATQRRTQSQEIETLRGRMIAWEREARCVEIATSVYDKWQERDQIRGEIDAIEGEAALPDEAPGQLVQIEAMLEERNAKLEEIKTKRRGLRDKSEQLPINKRLFDLQGRIEAASQQATWIEALEEQIDRLENQIEKARNQVDADADRLGIEEDERVRLGDGDDGDLPDLSRSTLSALSAPAKHVKEQMFLLKQARAEGKTHKVRKEKLQDQLQEILQRAHATDLQQAIRRENDNISTLRQRIQLGQHLEKLRRHYKDLERESVELTTDEAVPIDRLWLLSLPFIAGGMLLLYGMFNVFQIETFVAEPNPTQGMLCIMFGAMALLVYYLSREKGQRNTARDLDDCERQIDSVKRQLREIESEREDLDSSLAVSSESLEARLRESESLLAELDESMPLYHAHEAAHQSYQGAYKRAQKAAEGLKAARREWTATLDRLGLSTTLSPKSVRVLGDGYEALQTSLRRLTELKEERGQRQRERQSLAKRIETLYLEAIDASDDALRAIQDSGDHGSADHSNEYDDASGSYQSNEYEDADEDDYSESYARSQRKNPKKNRGDKGNRNRDRRDDNRSSESENGRSKRPVTMRSNPLDQLNHLHEEVARQQHWVKQRRQLKEHDVHLKKQQLTHSRAIERAEQQRRALWAKCGVATPEQFYEIVDRKSLLVQHNSEFESIDQQIRSMIGNTVEYDNVAREIEGAKSTDLERRWDSLTTRMTETESRIATLQTAQGELAQAMKQLGDDDRLMTARLELGCVERQLNQLSRRWQTLSMASCLLEDVCGTVENERQPETLREASSFLNQLTDGKYTRIWTPLGSNQLKIDDAQGNSLPLDVLSRGTGEAVFIALRLSLAAAYARRGVMLPLVLDDVLVNFDGSRAEHAARTLKTFAELGHQVMMFTCHAHIVEIFHEIGVEVRQMPAQGIPGRAQILPPPEEETYEEEEYVYEEDDVEEEPEMEVEEPAPEPEPTPEPLPPEPLPPEPQPIVIEAPKPDPVVVVAPPVVQPTPKPIELVVEDRRPAKPKSKFHYKFQDIARQHRRVRRPERVVERPVRRPKPKAEVFEEVSSPDAIGWAWFQREPADGRIDADEAAAEAARNQWLDEEDREMQSVVSEAEEIGSLIHHEATRSESGGSSDSSSSWWTGERTKS